MLKLRCDFRYHLLSVIKCEDQQPTTGQNHNHVTDWNITRPISASNWARKSVVQHKNPYCSSEKQNVSSRYFHINLDKTLICFNLFFWTINILCYWKLPQVSINLTTRYWTQLLFRIMKRTVAVETDATDSSKETENLTGNTPRRI